MPRIGSGPYRAGNVTSEYIPFWRLIVSCISRWLMLPLFRTVWVVGVPFWFLIILVSLGVGLPLVALVTWIFSGGVICRWTEDKPQHDQSPFPFLLGWGDYTKLYAFVERMLNRV